MVEVLPTLEKEVATLNQSWTGERPESIPMVPEHLSIIEFERLFPNKEKETLYIGLNKQTAYIEAFKLFKGNSLGIFVESMKQFQLIVPHLVTQLCNLKEKETELILLDGLGNLRNMDSQVDLFIDKRVISEKKEDLKQALQSVLSNSEKKRIIVINSFSYLVEKLIWTPDDVSSFLSDNQNNTQLILIDQMIKIGTGYGGLTMSVKDYISDILFGGDLQQQHFTE